MASSISSSPKILTIFQKKRKVTNGVTQISVRPPPLKSSAIESEVAVPVLWSGLLAMSFGVAAILATLVLEAILAVSWEWWLPLAVGVCVGVAILAWRLTVCERDRRELLLWPIESALGLDLDADGFVGEPEPETATEQAHRLIYVHGLARQEREQHAAADFRYFLRLAYDGKGTTWRTWKRERLPGGGLVTRIAWETWTNRLVNAGLATRPYPTAELELAGDFRQALATFRELL